MQEFEEALEGRAIKDLKRDGANLIKLLGAYLGA